MARCTNSSAGQPAIGSGRTADERFGVVLAGAYLAALIGGTLLLRFTGLESGGLMTWDRAIFWSVNALTCTGFRLSPNGLADFSSPGTLTVFGLMAIGGLTVLMAGGLLVCRIVGLPYGRRAVVAGSVALIFGGCIAGGLLLQAGGDPQWAGFFDAMSAITNGGFVAGGSVALDDSRVHLVLTPLAVLGAVGLPVLLDVVGSGAGFGVAGGYARRVIRVYVAFWLLAFVALVLVNSSLTWRNNLLYSWFHAINARSLGMESGAMVSRQTWWLMSALMLIGACPGGTGSGSKVTTLWSLAGECRGVLRGAVVGRTLAVGLCWLALYAVMFTILFLSLLPLAPQLPSERLFVIAAGSLGNTGLTHDPISLVGGPLYLLSAAMLAGQLAPLGFAVWVLRRRQGSWPVS